MIGTGQHALQYLSEALSKMNKLNNKSISISAAAGLADGVIAVFLSNQTYVILFLTHLCRPTAKVIQAMGGKKRVMPKEWAGLKLGYVWTNCRQSQVNFNWFLENYARAALEPVGPADIAWYNSPKLMPWNQNPPNGSLVPNPENPPDPQSAAAELGKPPESSGPSSANPFPEFNPAAVDKALAGVLLGKPSWIGNGDQGQLLE